MRTFLEPVSALAGQVSFVGRLVPRATRWVVCAALLAVGGYLGGYAGADRALAAEPSPSASTRQAEPVKYYIIGPTGTSEREYLFQIAARVLGDGRRYLEIFELNDGRLQPDGGRLEDPLVLMPGWILLLPPDANGPGVLAGTPPIFGNAQTSPSPSPSATEAVAAPPTSDGELRTAAFILIVVVLGLAIHLLRRGRRVETAAPAGAAGETRLALPPGPTRGRGRPARPLTDAAAGLRGADHSTAATIDTVTVEAVTVKPVRVEPTAPKPVVVEPTVRTLVTVEPAALSPVLLPPARRARSSAPAPHEPAPHEPAPPAQPAAPADPGPTRVEASLRDGPDLVKVRLIGARPDVGAAVLGRGQAAPRRAGGAVVRLGEAGPEALWVDLAVSPDVITITGSRPGVLRQSAQIARQLARAGVATVAVGDVPGVTDLAGRQVASLREVTDGSGSAQLLVAFLDELTPTGVAAVHDLIARRRPRVVAVAIGSGPRSRWSIDVS